MNNEVYVLGGAQTDFERNWTKEGKNEIALLKEVMSDALSSVKLTYDDLNALKKDNKFACFVGNFIGELYISQGHLGALMTQVNKAFYGVPCARYEAACASSSVAIDAALTKIKAGDFDLAAVVGWELMKTVDSKTCGDILGRAAYYEIEAKNIEYPFPKLFGRLADELIKKYSLNENRFLSNLSTIAYENYKNAKDNPLAQTRKWFMSLQQAESRGSQTNPIVGGKLGSADCSQITDGAVVVFLASERFIYKYFPNKFFPIIKGYGHRVAPMLFDEKIKESHNNNYLLPWTKQAVDDAYKKARLSVEDIDVFETHDCFTSSEYASISAFGITNPGEEYKAIEDAVIFKGGAKPINPSGGLIGCGHPVGASGARMLLDIYKQVAEEAGTYQVEGVRNAMMLNIGGSATTNYVFIVGKK